MQFSFEGHKITAEKHIWTYLRLSPLLKEGLTPVFGKYKAITEACLLSPEVSKFSKSLLFCQVFGPYNVMGNFTVIMPVPHINCYYAFKVRLRYLLNYFRRLPFFHSWFYRLFRLIWSYCSTLCRKFSFQTFRRSSYSNSSGFNMGCRTF